MKAPILSIRSFISSQAENGRWYLYHLSPRSVSPFYIIAADSLINLFFSYELKGDFQRVPLSSMVLGQNMIRHFTRGIVLALRLDGDGAYFYYKIPLSINSSSGTLLDTYQKLNTRTSWNDRTKSVFLRRYCKGTSAILRSINVSEFKRLTTAKTLPEYGCFFCSSSLRIKKESEIQVVMAGILGALW